MISQTISVGALKEKSQINARCRLPLIMGLYINSASYEYKYRGTVGAHGDPNDLLKDDATIFYKDVINEELCHGHCRLLCSAFEHLVFLKGSVTVRYIFVHCQFRSLFAKKSIRLRYMKLHIDRFVMIIRTLS